MSAQATSTEHNRFTAADRKEELKNIQNCSLQKKLYTNVTEHVLLHRIFKNYLLKIFLCSQ